MTDPDDDIAPDANDPGDTELDPELAELALPDDGDIVLDNVDQPDVKPADL